MERLFSIERPTKVPLLPTFVDKERVNVSYYIIYPYLTANVKFQDGVLVYSIKEPLLHPKEKKAFVLLDNKLKEIFNFESLKGNNFDVLERQVKLLVDELKIDLEIYSMHKITYFIYKDFLGLRELEPFSRDFFVNNIICERNKPVKLYHVKYGELKTNLVLNENLFDKLKNDLKKISVDGKFSDGSSIFFNESSFEIIKPEHKTITPITLIKQGLVSSEMLAYFWLLIQLKKRILFFGPAKSGKSSILNSLLFFVKEQDSLFSVEDNVNFVLSKELWDQNITIDSRTKEALIKDANADLLIIENLRREAKYLFKQKSGFMATIRAMDMKELMERLQKSPVLLNTDDIKSLDAVAFIRNRRIEQVMEPVRGEGFHMNQIFLFRANKFLRSERMHRVLDAAKELNLPKERVMIELKLRAKFLQKLTDANITDLQTIQKEIYSYYMNPNEVLKKWKII